jgi:hypothetical protein
MFVTDSPGTLDFAFASGTGSAADSGFGNLDTAIASGANSLADGGAGNFDTAIANGANSFADAVIGGVSAAAADNTEGFTVRHRPATEQRCTHVRDQTPRRATVMPTPQRSTITMTLSRSASWTHPPGERWRAPGRPTRYLTVGKSGLDTS